MVPGMTTYGLLIGHFGAFVRETYVEPVEPPRPEPESSDALHRVRELCGHHIIPLALLSRADGESVASERDAIANHCGWLMKDAGVAVSEAERTALKHHLESFQPTLMQLDLALKRIEHEPKERIAALFAAAINVVEADGKRDPGELRFLAKLSDDLAKIERG
jgi:tellurite resistance protein